MLTAKLVIKFKIKNDFYDSEVSVSADHDNVSGNKICRNNYCIQDLDQSTLLLKELSLTPIYN